MSSGHAQAGLAQGAHRPEGDEVVRREDGGREGLGFEDPARHPGAVGLVELAVVELAELDERLVEGEAGLGHRVPHAGQAIDRRGDVAAPRQDGDPAVAQRDEVIGERPRSSLRVSAHGVDVGGFDAAVDHDDGQLVGGEHAKRLPGVAGRDEEDPVDLALDEHPEVLLLFSIPTRPCCRTSRRSRVPRRRPRRRGRSW